MTVVLINTFMQDISRQQNMSDKYQTTPRRASSSASVSASATASAGTSASHIVAETDDATIKLRRFYVTGLNGPRPNYELNINLTDLGYRKSLQNGFTRLCKTRSVQDIEDFLESKLGKLIDPHANGEDAFVGACMDNSLDVVEYIYNRIGPDIAADNHKAFRFVCLANRVEVAQFLMKFNGQYFAKVCDDQTLDQSSVRFDNRTNFAERVKYDDELDMCTEYDSYDEWDYDNPDDSDAERDDPDAEQDDPDAESGE